MTLTYRRRRRHRDLRVLSLVLAYLVLASPSTYAQPAQAPDEDIQPRAIGTTGTTLIGVGGHVDRLFTADAATSFNYTVHGDVGRFLTRHILVQGGVLGSGSIGGDADAAAGGAGSPALHAFAGASWYFTPRGMVSLYSGGEYWAQLTPRDGPDAGALLAKLGLQGALSSRASLFVEGGFGIGLTRNDQGFPTRFVGRVGVRFKL